MFEYQLSNSEHISRKTPSYDPEGPQNYMRIVQKRANLTKNTLGTAMTGHRCSRSLSSNCSQKSNGERIITRTNRYSRLPQKK